MRRRYNRKCCVIGAGSVVTRDIPDGVLAAGVPCKVIRPITKEDDLENHPELFTYSYMHYPILP